MDTKTPAWIERARRAIAQQQESEEPPKPRSEQPASTLTIREHIAIQMLQGLLARGESYNRYGSVVPLATWMADQLLQELSTEPQELAPHEFEIIVEESLREAERLA